MNPLYIVGFLMFILGIILCVIGMLWIVLKGTSSGVSGGGLVMIGPFPIVFGTSKDIIKWMFIMALIFMVFMIVSTILPLIMGGGR